MNETSYRPGVPFLAGVVLTTIAFVIVAAGLIYRIGAIRVLAAIGFTSSRGIPLPGAVLDEIIGVGGVIENGPRAALPDDHDTVMVQSDPELDYRLRPNVRLDVVVLPSTGGIDLDPPVLNVPVNASLSETTRQYLNQAGRVRASYSTDAEARRTTVPRVSSEKKLLIVGDSVAFGIGVSDEDTAASQLQQLLGSAMEVVNGGVGGYDGRQAAGAADRLSRNVHYSTLVYIACQNDFMLSDDKEWIVEADEVLGRFKVLAPRFERVVVVFETELFYEARDVLLAHGWPKSVLDSTARLQAALPASVKRFGFSYVDWSPIVNAERLSRGSIFAPFALYFDQTHLSREGNRLMAGQIARAVQ